MGGVPEVNVPLRHVVETHWGDKRGITLKSLNVTSNGVRAEEWWKTLIPKAISKDVLDRGARQWTNPAITITMAPKGSKRSYAKELEKEFADEFESCAKLIAQKAEELDDLWFAAYRNANIGSEPESLRQHSIRFVLDDGDRSGPLLNGLPEIVVLPTVNRRSDGSVIWAEFKSADIQKWMGTGSKNIQGVANQPHALPKARMVYVLRTTQGEELRKWEEWKQWQEGFAAAARRR
ncbi:Uu.00g100760.m01.CDS01 [Anthostomella pinea]|uniref:Uu.00g100760.m01.CDS01 n=1 Tax=Anthostomella pinea TaxID=933095 RepID=A0AAI8YF93_9PEZI|nr:Uu.00g100760.m01.CDS01 [Anthostomella pinea]